MRRLRCSKLMYFEFHFHLRRTSIRTLPKCRSSRHFTLWHSTGSRCTQGGKITTVNLWTKRTLKETLWAMSFNTVRLFYRVLIELFISSVYFHSQRLHFAAGALAGQPRVARRRQTVSGSFEGPSRIGWTLRVPPVDQHAPADDLPDGAERRFLAFAAGNDPTLDGNIQLAHPLHVLPRHPHSRGQVAAGRHQSQQVLYFGQLSAKSFCHFQNYHLLQALGIGPGQLFYFSEER